MVNVAGPHSAIVNGMAGALGDMTIRTQALRQEVVHVATPPDFDFESLGFVVSDSDIGCYIRPETGNQILVGSEIPSAIRENLSIRTTMTGDFPTRELPRLNGMASASRQSEFRQACGCGRSLRRVGRLDSHL